MPRSRLPILFAFALIAASLLALAPAAPAKSVRLYRAVSPEGRTSYLYPSFHLPDERITRPSLSLLDRVKHLVIEADIADAEKHPERMVPYVLNPQPVDLAALFTPEEITVIRARALCNGMPFGVERLRLFFIEMIVGLPCPKVGAVLFERRLQQEAETRGYRVTALESADEEFKAVFSLPDGPVVDEIKKYTDHPDAAAEVLDRMVAIYNSGDYDKLYAFTVQNLPKKDGARQAFVDRVLVQRNRTMVERMAGALTEGDALVVVGAAHLPGENGIVDLLRRRGFKISTIEVE
jgi:uncharacterized protein YbaP (TraB family)